MKIHVKKIRTKSRKTTNLPPEHRYNFIWPHYRALRQLYQEERTNLAIDSNKFVLGSLIRRKGWIQPKKMASQGFEIPRHFRESYNEWYEIFCKNKIDSYQQFFTEHNVPDEGTHPYREEDILSLMTIASQKENIRLDLDSYSANSFSEEFFKGKGAKYMRSLNSLYNAVKAILKIDKFPGEDSKDNQWRLAVECDDAEVLVLCENTNFLRLPETAKKNRIDLWCVSGNNIAAVERIPAHKIQLPTYYSCDWDDAGLHIFLRIKEKIEAKGHKIQLLYPSASSDKFLSIDSPHHNSNWKLGQPLSGLNPKCFSRKERDLIRYLINADQWIEEESNNLAQMVTSARN